LDAVQRGARAEMGESLALLEKGTLAVVKGLKSKL
jgi:hypothetical protein